MRTVPKDGDPTSAAVVVGLFVPVPMVNMKVRDWTNINKRFRRDRSTVAIRHLLNCWHEALSCVPFFRNHEIGCLLDFICCHSDINYHCLKKMLTDIHSGLRNQYFRNTRLKIQFWMINQHDLTPLLSWDRNCRMRLLDSKVYSKHRRGFYQK